MQKEQGESRTIQASGIEYKNVKIVFFHLS